MPKRKKPSPNIEEGNIEIPTQNEIETMINVNSEELLSVQPSFPSNEEIVDFLKHSKKADD